MAGLNQECCEPAPPPAGGVYVCVGGLETFQHLTAYVTGSPHAKAAVIFASHALGFEVSNLRKLADKVAAAGYYVVVPDYFHGEPLVLGSAENRLAGLGDWLKRHGPEKGFEDSTKVIEVLKSRGISTIGAVGFCWGAKVVVELLKGEDVKAGLLLHPSFVTVDDIKEVKVPLTILVPEIDEFCTPEIVEQFRAILSAKPEVDSFVKIYPGVAHGFTLNYNENDEVAVRNAEEAHAKMLEWLNKYFN